MPGGIAFLSVDSGRGEEGEEGGVKKEGVAMTSGASCLEQCGRVGRETARGDTGGSVREALDDDSK